MLNKSISISEALFVKKININLDCWYPNIFMKIQYFIFCNSISSAGFGYYLDRVAFDINIFQI